jgi:hypothetical protein
LSALVEFFAEYSCCISKAAWYIASAYVGAGVGVGPPPLEHIGDLRPVAIAFCDVFGRITAQPPGLGLHSKQGGNVSVGAGTADTVAIVVGRPVGDGDVPPVLDPP